MAVYGGGLTRYRAGAFTTLTTANGLVDDFVRAVAVDATGALWVGTDRGLSRYAGGAFTSFTAKDGLNDPTIRVIYPDATGGGVLIGTSLGLQRVLDGRIVTVPIVLSGQPVVVDAITRDRAGRLWVGTSDGLIEVSSRAPVAYGPAQGLSSLAVRGVFEDSHGGLWVATNKGLDRSVTGVPVPGRFAPVLADVDVTVVLEDREDSVWVGTRGRGLVRLQRSLFRVWGTNSGLPSNTATTVFETGDGTIWAGVGTSLAAIRGGEVTNYGLERGLPDRAISALAEDVDGHLWVGSEGGLYRSTEPVRARTPARPVRFAAIGTLPALRTHVRVICADGQAGMVVGTNADGVVRVARNGTTFPVQGLPNHEIRALVCGDPDGLWIGTRGAGLLRVSAARVTAFTTQEGLPNDSIQSLYRDADGVLWIATRRGMCRLKNGRLTAITREHGLAENHVYGLTLDGAGRFWMASGRGVFTVEKRQMDEFADGKARDIASVVFGLEHGLPSTLCAISHHPVVITANDGGIWLATLGGLVDLNPVGLSTTSVVPPVQVENVFIDDQPHAAIGLIRAPHGLGTLVFRYTAPNYLAPDQVQFRYRLEGSDPAWVQGGSSREARYTNIPPGRYRFIVTARSRGGAWNTAGATAELDLVPHFYQTGWFYALVGFVVVGSVGGAYRVRIAQLRARERELARRIDDAIAQIKVLSGLLPTCSWCKKIRDDSGNWTQMEAYILDHSQAVFSHGLCPDCLRQHYPDVASAVESSAADRT